MAEIGFSQQTFKKSTVDSCFTPFFSVSIVDFEQVNVRWIKLLKLGPTGE